MTFSSKQLTLLSIVLLLGECILTALIILKVPYTEIDWKAYMQEVSGYLSGQTDYYQLYGDTGPLVYPAGFVYLYSALYYITDLGQNIAKAQWVFYLLYLAFIFVLHRIYLASTRHLDSKATALMLILLTVSRRIHSLFVLRLFNDCFAMFFAYVSIALFIKNKWAAGCLFYSIAVSIKMNVLLMAPGLLALLLLRFPMHLVIRHLNICALVQFILALPFITSYPVSYLHRSFEIGRQFMYKWTVNWKMIPEEVFLSKPFAIGLLLLHVTLLVIIAIKKWMPYLRSSALTLDQNIDPDMIVKVMFSANFIGVALARSLHYQFYVWYYHSLPFLLFSCNSFLAGSIFIPIALILVLEICWNIYPSNYMTSSVIFLIHSVILMAIFADKSLWNPSRPQVDKLLRQKSS